MNDVFAEGSRGKIILKPFLEIGIQFMVQGVGEVSELLRRMFLTVRNMRNGWK
jgi:hypothetical protein